MSVVCGPLETVTVRKNGKSIGQAVTNPVVIVEVLSDATERYDRYGKFQSYKRIVSLREYALVSEEEPRIEVFRRDDGWVGEVGGRGMVIRIHGASVDVDAMHAG